MESTEPILIEVSLRTLPAGRDRTRGLKIAGINY